MREKTSAQGLKLRNIESGTASTPLSVHKSKDFPLLWRYLENFPTFVFRKSKTRICLGNIEIYGQTLRSGVSYHLESDHELSLYLL